MIVYCTDSLSAQHIRTAGYHVVTDAELMCILAADVTVALPAHSMVIGASVARDALRWGKTIVIGATHPQPGVIAVKSIAEAVYMLNNIRAQSTASNNGMCPM